MAQGTVNLSSALAQVTQNQGAKAVNLVQQAAVPFKTVLSDALSSGQAQAIQVSQGAQTFATRQQIGAPPSIMDDQNLMVQAIPEEFQQIEDIIRNQEQKDEAQAALAIQETGYRSHKLDITPFQLFMDKSIASLENLSKMEMQVNDLMEQYIQGRASIDEVSMETAKLNLSLQFVTSVLTSAVQTFKEVLQMAI